MADTLTSYYDLVLRVSEQGTAKVDVAQKAMRDQVRAGEKAWQSAAATATKSSTAIVGAAEKAAKGVSGSSTQITRAQKDQQKAVADAAAATKAALEQAAAAWEDTAKVALGADERISKSAADAAAAVDRATQKEIASLRATGATYEDIAAMAIKGNALRAKSAADTAAAIELAAGREAAAMKSRSDKEVERGSLGSRVRRGVGSTASGIAGIGGSVLRGAGGIALGGIGLAGAATYEGLRKGKELTEETIRLRGSSGLSSRDALALATISGAVGVNSRSVGQAFNTIGAQVTKAKEGNVGAIKGFETLKITKGQVEASKDNLPALFDLITKRASTLPAAERAALQKQFLGRGTQVAGQLEAAGPLAGQIKEVRKDLGPIKPETLKNMQESFIKLKETTTTLELSFAQAFGPTLVKLLQAITPLMRPLGTLLQGAIKTGLKAIGDLIKGPVGQGLATFGKAAFKAGSDLIKAFAPAQPFLKNVLLPLLKGVAEGVGIALIGALKLLTPVVKVVSEGLGALGKVLEPVKGLFEDVGKVVGIVFSGEIVGAVAEVGKATEAIPLLGKVLSPIGDIVSGVGGIFVKAFGLMHNAVRVLVGAVTVFGGDILHGIESAFSSVVDFVGGLVGTFENVGKSLLEGLVKPFVALGDLLVTPIKGAINLVIEGVDSALHAAHNIYKDIPFVPAWPLPDPAIPKLAGGGWVPGSPHEDGTLALLSGNEFVLTGDGQAQMDAHAPGLLEHIAATQLPHFKTGGGWEPKTSSRPKKPEKAKAYLVGTEEVHETPAQHAARSLKERKEKAEAKNEGTGKWVRVGATIDPTQGQAPTYSAHGGMSFAELLEAGANTGLRPDLTQLLGLKRGQYGMAMETPLYARALGGRTAYEIWKNDVGSGQKGDPHYAIDLHSKIAQMLGLNGKGDIEVSTGKAGGASSTAAAGVPELSNPALVPGEAFFSGFEAGRKGENAKTVTEAAIAAAKTSLSSASGAGATGAGGSESPQTIEQMYKAVQHIIGRPYVFGGGHGGFNSAGYDCSGAVSYALHAGGLASSPMTTDALKNWGQPGPGAGITVGVRGSTGANAHTMIKFGNHYLEAGGGGPYGKPSVHWDKGWDGTFTTWRHPGGEAAGAGASSPTESMPLSPGSIAPKPASGRSTHTSTGTRSAYPRNYHGPPNATAFKKWQAEQEARERTHERDRREHPASRVPGRKRIPGMRRGGRLPGYRRGGYTGRSTAPLVDSSLGWLNGSPDAMWDPRDRAFVGYGLRTGGWMNNPLARRRRGRGGRRGHTVQGAVSQGLNDVLQIGGTSDEAQVDTTLEDLGHTLEAAKKLTLDQLKRFASEVKKQTAKMKAHGATPIQLRRLQSALDVVEGVIGNRIGVEVKAIEEAGDVLAAGVSGKGASLRLNHQRVVQVGANGLAGVVTLGGGRSARGGLLGFQVQQERLGIGANSQAGLGASILSGQTAIPQLEAQMKLLDQARRRAKAAHSPKAVAAIEGQMDKLQETITESVTDLMVKQQELVMTAAQDKVTSATHSQTIAQGAGNLLEATQIRQGQGGSAGAFRAQAAQLRQEVLPSQQGVLAALKDQEGSLAGLATAGNTTAAASLLQVQEQIQQQQLAILQTQNEAAEKLMEAARAQVTAAQGRVSLASAQYAGLQLEEQLAGTAGAPSAIRNAEFITQHLVPAQKEVVKANEEQLEEDRKNQASEQKINEDLVALQEANNALMQDNVDATEAVKENTTRMVDASGSLSFSFQGQSMTDLINVGVGA